MKISHFLNISTILDRIDNSGIWLIRENLGISWESGHFLSIWSILEWKIEACPTGLLEPPTWVCLENYPAVNLRC